MRTGTVIQMAVQQMQCTACGAEANASCSCGKPYVPKKQLALEKARENPKQSVRALAEETGVSHGTAQNALREVRSGVQDCTAEGRDGKVYRLPQRDDENEEPDAEHEAGVRVISVRGFLNRAAEAKEIATLGKLTAPDVTEAMIVAADEAAAAWNLAALNLRRMKSNG